MTSDAVVTIGGLRAHAAPYDIVGILEGTADNTARNSATIPARRKPYSWPRRFEALAGILGRW
jgi:hypothetical protein